MTDKTSSRQEIWAEKRAENLRKNLLRRKAGSKKTHNDKQDRQIDENTSKSE